VQKILEKEYPEKGRCRGKFDKNNAGKRREDIEELNISETELKKTLEVFKKNNGCLKLTGFTSLKKLYCAGNQLTSLDLSNCPNLVYLDCSDNKFANLNFLNPSRKGLPNPEKLERLIMAKNEGLLTCDLLPLTSLIGLKELNIENCPFKGSLEPLKVIKNLEEIHITNTDIDQGIEDLPISCQKIYCEYNPQSRKKSIKISQELRKHSEEKIDYEKKYYELIT